MNAPLLPATLASAADGPLLVAAAATSTEARITDTHRHARGQLLGATQGLLTVEAAHWRWVVPATHAVWVPPDVTHGVESHGPFAGWSVYVTPAACAALPEQPGVIATTGLLREAVARATRWPKGALDAIQQRLAAVLLDEIAAAPRATLGLPLPSDARLLKIARALLAQPAEDRKLEDWAAWDSVAPRTLTRRFAAETGLSFSDWRQRVRLLRALELLTAGHSVKHVALDLGHANVSGFIAAFRRCFGVTPGRLAELGAAPS